MFLVNYCKQTKKAYSGCRCNPIQCWCLSHTAEFVWFDLNVFIYSHYDTMHNKCTSHSYTRVWTNSPSYQNVLKQTYSDYSLPFWFYWQHRMRSVRYLYFVHSGQENARTPKLYVFMYYSPDEIHHGQPSTTAVKHELPCQPYGKVQFWRYCPFLKIASIWLVGRCYS